MRTNGREPDGPVIARWNGNRSWVYWGRSRARVGRKSSVQLHRFIIHLILVSDIGFKSREQTILGAST